MAKQLWKPSTILNPVPAVMVSCCDREGKPNIITIAWAGTINSKPPMVSISIRKERYSYNLIKEKGQFVINLTTRKLAFAADFCGVKSGRDVDKFEAMKLTCEKASVVDVPMIKESPVNIECTVKDIIELGSHDMFIAEIEAINVDESIIDKNGRLCMEKADLICYSHGEYWSLEKSLGYFGYSITKKKKVLRRRTSNKKGR
ncbi:MAG TPA: flavin reductase family protein [Acetivibrio sp.]|uniref:flavin reductase family protein n=1 Tax=Acetivibrio sp. TaxID=1872092 RepID=UPI002C682591|nr:flavin reductase family protein [Acetivibrio sp.]HOM02195.1 flavin reductase family protein [Acetivibrio sp.]